MCGIHAVVSQGISNLSEISPGLKQSLSCRGPDHFGQLHCQVTDTEKKTVYLTFTSTVLALRGDHVTAQPLRDAATGSVLCWNGEAWKIDGQGIQGNDAEAIMARLHIPETTIISTRESHILGVLRSIEGPFAFLYYDSVAKRLYYGRDRLGRRSLLRYRSQDGQSMAFSSVADEPASGWEEVIADGVYSMHLDVSTETNGLWSTNGSISRHDWVFSADTDMVSAVAGFSDPCTHLCYGYELTTVGLKYWSFQYGYAPVK